MSDLRHLDPNMPILIVDDFSTMRRIIRNALKTLGFNNITEADDGQNAWDKMQESEFQFIVSDWNMPNMMGIDLLKTARASDKYKTVPFMMLTAEAQKDSVSEVEDAGASSCVVKPITTQVLESRMEAIFRKAN